MTLVSAGMGPGGEAANGPRQVWMQLEPGDPAVQLVELPTVIL